MSKLTLLLTSLLFSVMYLHAQDITYYKGHKVFAKTAIVKLNVGSSLKLADAQSEIPQLAILLKKIGATSLIPMFPNSFYENCANCVDISTIYQFTYTIDVPIESLIEALNRIPEVIYAQPEFVHELCYVPNDPRLNQQYFHTTINSYGAWDSVRCDSTVIIGISDTGCDITHDDLVGSIAYNYNDPINGVDDDNDGYIDNFRGWDFGENDNNPSVEASDHGNWVSGLAAATSDNGIGIAGSSFGARFMPIKIATSGGSLRQTWSSIVYAADHGCQIINCSWGNTYKEPLGEDIVNYATFNRNALVVAAAGNNSTQEEYYPASYRNALSVAGTVANDEKWSKSNSQSAKGSSWGYFVDVTAPAAGYYSTAMNNGYTFMYGGTSFACPIVAGVAALVKFAFPELSSIALAEQIKAQSDKIDTIAFNFPYEDMLGTGRINSRNASTNIDRPGIRYTNFSLNKNSVLLPGDTVVLKLDLANYLASTESANISLEFNSKFIKLINNKQLIKNFSHNDTIVGLEFSFTFSSELPLDFEAFAKLVYHSHNYRTYEYINIPTNPSTKRLISSMIDVSLPANGRVGSTKLIDKADNYLSAIGYNDLIADAGLFFVEASNKVATSFLGKQDFNIIQQTLLCDDDSSDYCFNSRYRADLLELEILQSVLAWNDSSYFILNYKINSTSLLEKPNLIIGNYWDWNVMNAWNNYTGYHQNTGMSYTYNTEPATLYVGTMILSADTNNVYVSDNNSPFEGFPDIYGNNSADITYQCATTWSPEVKKLNLGSNTSVFQSAMPRYLDRGDTIEHQVAVLFNEDLQKLVLQAERLRNTSITPSTIQGKFTLRQPKVFPTLTTGSVHISGIKVDASLSVTLLTPKGQVISVPSETVGDEIELHLQHLPKGMYYISVVQDQTLHTLKIMRQ